MRELYRSAHFLVTFDEERKLVCRKRTDLGFASPAQIEAAYAALLDVVEPFHHPDHALLADLRLAPPRNDPAYEAIISLYYHRLFAGFHKIAVLVKMEAGRLQILRLATPEVAPRMRPFTDERAAFDFLFGPPTPPTPPTPGRRPR